MLTTIIQNHSGDDTPWEQLKACGIQNHTQTFSLQNAIAGKVLLHAKRQIDAFREHMGVSLCVFKIGVTSNPAERFLSYSVKHFAAMWVVYSGSDLGMVHMLEAALILITKKHLAAGMQPTLVEKGGSIESSIWALHISYM